MHLYDQRFSRPNSTTNIKDSISTFRVSKSKPFKLYADFAEFDCDVHNVKIGSGQLNTSSWIEIIFCPSQSKAQTNIVEPINERTATFYSVHNDGSSAAKIMDKKEIFRMKSAPDGEVKFQVLSLEEPANTDANGLKTSLDHSLSKLKCSTRTL